RGSVAQLLARREDRHRAQGGQNRPGDRERARRRGAARAEAAGAGGHHQEAGDAMTTLPPDFPDFPDLPDLPDLPGPSPSPSPPETPQRFSDLFAERDSSLALAAAALARVADGQGHAMF